MCVVQYFLFVVCLDVFAVVTGIFVLYLHLHAESKPVPVIPARVSIYTGNNCETMNVLSCYIFCRLFNVIIQTAAVADPGPKFTDIVLRFILRYVL